VISIVVLCAIFAPLLSPGDPLRLAGPPRQWPFQIAQYPLGTDLLGRDILAMLIYGARVSLTIGIVASIVSTLIGLSIGALSGYYGGWINDILMRVTEIFQTIPSFLFALVLVTPSRS